MEVRGTSLGGFNLVHIGADVHRELVGSIRCTAAAAVVGPGRSRCIYIHLERTIQNGQYYNTVNACSLRGSNTLDCRQTFLEQRSDREGVIIVERLDKILADRVIGIPLILRHFSFGYELDEVLSTVSMRA